MRGIRGAICARDNSKDEIYRATRVLLGEMLERNRLGSKDIVAAFFTMTPDLDADFPAYAARDMGWTDVPILGAQESLVPGAPRRAIRVLLLARGDGPTRPVYLGRAAAMRPDLAEPGDGDLWDSEPSARPWGRTADGREMLVVGLGLIGGSVAAGARRSGLFAAVRGYDENRDTAALALERGLVHDLAADLAVEMQQADIVVLATPVSTIVRLIEDLGGHLKPGAIVTDVGSTKRTVVDAMAALPDGIRAVGGHPMTGSTASGAASASADLFEGARWALIQTKRSDEEAMTAVEEVVLALGAHPVRMSADDHDRIVAMTSQLPAAIAVSLVEAAGVAIEPNTALLAGPGFLSATRLAEGDPLMTSQMLAENAHYLGVALERFVASLREVVRDAAGDPAVLAERLAEARGLRSSLLERPLG